MDTTIALKRTLKLKGALLALVTLLAFVLSCLVLPAQARAASTGWIGDVATEVNNSEVQGLSIDTSNPQGPLSTTYIDMEPGKAYVTTYPASVDYYGETLGVRVTVTLTDDQHDATDDAAHITIGLNGDNKVTVSWAKANRSKIEWKIETIDADGNPVSTNLVTGIADPDESNYLFDTSSYDLYYIPKDPAEGATTTPTDFTKGFKVEADGIYPYNTDGENLNINYANALILVALDDASGFTFTTDTFTGGGMSVPFYYRITKEFKINYVLDGGTNDSSNPTSYTSGGDGLPITIKDPSKTGYKFLGWKEGDTIDKSDVGDKTFTAQWDPVYTITYDANGGEGTMEDQEFYGSDETMTSRENTFTKAGRTFAGFKAYITDPETGEETVLTDENGEPLIFENATDLAEYLKDKPGGTSIRMEAQWTYTVTYIDPATGETIQSNVVDDGDGEPAAPADPTREGYTFGGWKKTVDENGNIIYEAIWTYTVTYRDPVSGKVYQTTVVADGEDEPQPPADPKRAGYNFVGWKKIVDENGNIIYEALWEKKALLPITGDPTSASYLVLALSSLLPLSAGVFLRKKEK